jgi:hypothetical protein
VLVEKLVLGMEVEMTRVVENDDRRHLTALGFKREEVLLF